LSYITAEILGNEVEPPLLTDNRQFSYILNFYNIRHMSPTKDDVRDGLAELFRLFQVTPQQQRQ